MAFMRKAWEALKRGSWISARGYIVFVKRDCLQRHRVVSAVEHTDRRYSDCTDWRPDRVRASKWGHCKQHNSCRAASNNNWTEAGSKAAADVKTQRQKPFARRSQTFKKAVPPCLNPNRVQSRNRRQIRWRPRVGLPMIPPIRRGGEAAGCCACERKTPAPSRLRAAGGHPGWDGCNSDPPLPTRRSCDFDLGHFKAKAKLSTGHKAQPNCA